MEEFERGSSSYDPRNGAIIYKRGKNSKHKAWKNIYKRGVESYRSIKPLDKSAQSLTEIKTFFEKASKDEYNREIAILSKVFNSPPKDIGEYNNFIKYIQYINTKMGFGSEYKSILKGLDYDIKNLNANKLDGTISKGRMQSMVVQSFVDYLITYLASFDARKIIDSALQKANDINFEEILKNAVETVINKGIEAAWDEMMSADITVGGTKKKKEKDQYWQRLYKEYVDKFGKEKIVNEVKNKLNGYWQIDKLKQVYKDLYSAKTNKFKTHTKGYGNNKFKKNIVKASNYKGTETIENTVRQIGGFLGQIIGSHFGSRAESSVKIKGHTAHGDMAKTDNIFLLSTDVELDLNPLIDAFEYSFMQKTNKNGEQVGLRSLEEAAEQHEKFYKQVIEPAEDLYIIYESTKMYTLGKSFEGVSSGTQKVEALLKRAELLNEVGINPDKAKDIVGRFYNTMPGAIGEKDYNENRTDISFMVAATAASFLFDDWKTIGNKSGKGIHVFNIDNVYIPLSYVLQSMGKTMETMIEDREKKHFIRLNIDKPKGIKYPEKIDISNAERKAARDKGMNPVLPYWQEQTEIAKSQFKFSFKFLRNFKQIVSDQLGYIK